MVMRLENGVPKTVVVTSFEQAIKAIADTTKRKRQNDLLHERERVEVIPVRIRA